MSDLADTDVLANWLRGREEDVSLLSSLAPQGLAISLITFGEIYDDIYSGYNLSYVGIRLNLCKNTRRPEMSEKTRNAASLVTHFEDLEDPRVERQRRNKMVDILVIGICTVICGGDDYPSMEAIAFREDESRIRKGHGPQNFAVLRHIALNALKQEKSTKLGVRNKRLKAGWDHDYLLKILGLIAN